MTVPMKALVVVGTARETANGHVPRRTTMAHRSGHGVLADSLEAMHGC